MGKDVSVFKFSKIIATTLAFATIATPFTNAKAEESNTTATAAIDLQILETTDLHDNVMGYDYYKDTEALDYGFARTATLINQARQESENNLLFDAGDTIQGNPMADYVAKVKGLSDTEVHPMIKSMNIENYDVATFGNHEFNYGLDYAKKVTGKAQFPYVNANIYNAKTGENEFTPYVILDKTFKDQNGNSQKVKVGVIGFAPPQIMDWDKDNLTGKVVAKDMVKTAQEFIPKVKAAGADIVVALVHSGCDVATTGLENAENAVYDLSKVEGINAILFGHKHTNFPGAAEFNKVEGIDNTIGTINGVPAVEAGFWGNNLGVMKLTLTADENGKYTKVESKGSQLRPVYDATNKKSLAEENPTIVEAVKQYHDGTLNYVRGKIGVTSAPMYSYFARVQDDPTIQIVNNAQTWFAKDFIAKNLPEYKDVPVLSAAAPFKSGRGGASDYTSIGTGVLSIKSANDLYLFPNTLKAVELTGAQVKEWLEMSAGQFKQIDPAVETAQELVDNSFPGYNYDVIDGVTYQVDVTKPAKYKSNGDLLNADASRIVNLEYNGQPIKEDQKFIIVTNNYRASGGGNFPGLKGGKAKVVIDTIEENRTVLMNYIQNQGVVNPTADKNWMIAPIAGNPEVIFKSSTDAKKVLSDSAHITFKGEANELGVTWGVYAYNTNLTVDSISDKATSITGKTIAGATVTVKAGNTTVGTGTADSKGVFTITIAKQKAGTTLVITATSEGKDTSVTATVIDRTAPTPVVAPVSNMSTTISGTTEANAKVEVLKGSTVLVSGNADSQGKFTLDIAKQVAGTILSVVSTDTAGNISNKINVTVIDKIAPVKPVVNTVNSKSTTISGSTEKDATITVKSGKKVIATGKATSTGNFTIKIKAQSPGTVLAITATDLAKNESQITYVVVKDATPPAKPVITGNLTSKSTTISGRGEAGTTVTVKVGSKVIGTGKVSSKGTFNVKISRQKRGTTVVVYLTDGAKNVSEGQKKVVK
ncbi:bifunctional 2',3'-cyclic-nucleotide 2'-phosphodiesterase/3'-nucleotidase [Gottfriedia luciferensis]|uniref:bifunctional 2',3'-cyclic-nucleotide 2'-phosphodiesterase/3'-nucleotidase n=1 Tax=Gottfriedia luciferensis TaxID=178774 RepID=UPI000B44A11E|nr:bifunctional 2',3'-cyclic-nucleotide 2'-phosphodiesterase/3'-nucleotidase [Gottfriedia luciferensis]